MGELTPLENMKVLWHYRDEKYEDGWVVFLGDSKHKIKKRLGVRALNLDFSHMADVKKTGFFPRLPMLIHNSAKGNGHFPTRKRDELCRIAQMKVV